MKILLSILLFLSSMLWLTAQDESGRLFHGFDPDIFYDQHADFTKSDCDTIFSFVSPVPHPSGVANVEGDYWVVGRSFILVVDANGIFQNSIPNPAPEHPYRGGDICYDGELVWYVDEPSSKLFGLDPNDGSILKEFDLPGQSFPDPNDWGIAYDGEHLWHSHYRNPAALYKIDRENGNIIDSLPVDRDYLGPIVFFNEILFGVSFNSEYIYQIDETSGNVIDSLEWCVPLPLGVTTNDSLVVNASNYSLWSDPKRIYGVKTILTYTGTDEKQVVPGMEIHPNPARDHVFVRAVGPVSGAAEVSIRSLQGKTIYQEKVFLNDSGLLRIPVADLGLKPGIYMVMIETSGGRTVKKLVVAAD